MQFSKSVYLDKNPESLATQFLYERATSRWIRLSRFKKKLERNSWGKRAVKGKDTLPSVAQMMCINRAALSLSKGLWNVISRRGDVDSRGTYECMYLLVSIRILLGRKNKD